MSGREALKILHILAAMVWFGGGVLARLMAGRVAAARTKERALGFSQDMAAATRVLTGSKVVVLATGILLVTTTSGWDFDQPWIMIGTVVAVLAVVSGFGYFRPETGRLIDEIEGEGYGKPENIARFKRLGRVSNIEQALVVVAVWAMVTHVGL